MVERYRQSLRSLVARSLPDAGMNARLDFKHFFGGAAAYVDGRIFATLSRLGLALKLPEDTRSALLNDGAKPLQYFPKAPIKKDYVVLPEGMSKEGATLAPLFAESLRYCRTLPRPERAKRRKTRSQGRRITPGN